MAIERRGILLTVLVSLGAAAVVFGLLPGPWPNPLPEGPLAGAPAVERLRGAAAVVDAACAAGDVQAFEAATTSAMRQQLAGRLRAGERTLDAGTLRELAPTRPWSTWLEQPILAGQVHGVRAAVAVQRPQGDGAQVLEFVWDGHHLRCDGTRHATAVRDAAAAQQIVEDAVFRRER